VNTQEKVINLSGIEPAWAIHVKGKKEFVKRRKTQEAGFRNNLFHILGIFF